MARRATLTHGSPARSCRIRAIPIAIVAALTVTIVLTSCSSDSGGQGAASGKAPIPVMVMGTFHSPALDLSDAAAAVQAKAAQVNAGGGIGGRLIKVTECDDQGNPNRALTCARQAVSDHVVAVLSPTQASGFGAQTLPILHGAGIAAIGEPAVVAADWTSPNSFPLDPGSPARNAATVLAFKNAGCTAVGTVQVNVPAGPAVIGYIKDALDQLGGKLVLNLPVGQSMPSYDAQIAQLVAAGAKCIDAVIFPSEEPKLLSAIRQSAKGLIFGGISANFNQTVLNSMGAAADGILMGGAPYLPTDTSVPAVQKMLAVMKQYTPKSPAVDSYASAAWGAATLLFGSVLPSIIGDITPQAVIAGLKATKEADAGTYAPYTFGDKPPDPDFPQIREKGVLTWRVEASRPVLTSPKYIDIYEVLSSGR